MLDLLAIMLVLRRDKGCRKPGPRKLNGQIEPSVRLVILSLTTLIVGGTLQFGNQRGRVVARLDGARSGATGACGKDEFGKID